MHKFLVMAATALVAGSFASAALAQQRSTREDDRPTVNQIVAQDEARLARLKAELRLKQDQEGAWTSFEKALRDLSRQRAERFVAWWDENTKRTAEAEKSKDSPKPITLAEALRLRADVMEKHAADLRKIADAADPLFGKLDEAQKRRVAEMIRQYAAAGSPAQAAEPRGRRRSWFW